MQKVTPMGGPEKFLDACQSAVDELVSAHKDEKEAVTPILEFWVRQCTNV